MIEITWPVCVDLEGYYRWDTLGGPVVLILGEVIQRRLLLSRRASLP